MSFLNTSFLNTALKIGVAGTLAAWSAAIPAKRVQGSAPGSDGSMPDAKPGASRFCITGMPIERPVESPRAQSACPSILTKGPSADLDEIGVLSLKTAPRPMIDERPRPQWEHQFHDKGPSIELGALGFGRPGTPSLVHFAFAWDF